MEVGVKEQEVSRLQIGRRIFVLYRRSNGTYRSEPIPMPEQLQAPQSSRKLIAVVPSESNPKHNHYMYRESSGEITCTCFGFRSVNKCWHFRRLMERIEEGLDLELLQDPIRNLVREV